MQEAYIKTLFTVDWGALRLSSNNWGQGTDVFEAWKVYNRQPWSPWHHASASFCIHWIEWIRINFWQTKTRHLFKMPQIVINSILRNAWLVLNLKGYYEIVGESRSLSGFFPHMLIFYRNTRSSQFQSDPSPNCFTINVWNIDCWLSTVYFLLSYCFFCISFYTSSVVFWYVIFWE